MGQDPGMADGSYSSGAATTYGSAASLCGSRITTSKDVAKHAVDGGGWRREWHGQRRR